MHHISKLVYKKNGLIGYKFETKRRKG